MIEIPGYKIVRLLGKGGMAEVYLAIQQCFEREVALKILSQSHAADQDFSERFLREAKIVSRLVHPNIVTVYDVGVVAGRHFLSMEYIPGQDLKTARRQLSLEQRLAVLKDIAQALSFAGKKGYVHRDVKPENIILHEDDGRAVLLDFGIARPSDLHQGMTLTGMAVGTPYYMSPEQARGEPVDPRSDIYSLGVLLYLMLTGQVPYDGDSAVAVGVKHVSAPVPQLPPNLQLFQPLVAKALAKNPAHRYQDAAALAADLERIGSRGLDPVELPEASPLSISAIPAAEVPAAAIPATEISATDPQSQRSHAAPAQPPVVVQRSGGGSWAWLLGLAIAAGIGFGVYFQQQLPVEQRLGAGAAAAAQSGVDSRTAPAEQSGPDRVLAPDKVVDPAGPGNALDANQPAPQLPGASAASSALEVEQARPEQALVDQISPDQAWPDQAWPDQAWPDQAVAAPMAAAAVTPETADTSSNAEATAVDSIGPALTQLNGQSSLALRAEQLQQARQLQARLEQEPELLLEVAAIYRELITSNPLDIEAAQALQALRGASVDTIEGFLAQRDYAAARQAAALARAAFTADVYKSRLQKLEQSIADEEVIHGLLDTAAGLMQQNYLTLPEDNNAWRVYRQVLAIDPQRPEALQGLAQISRRYAAIARRHLAEANPAEAQVAIDRGLLVRAEDPDLLDLQARMQQSAAIDLLRARALQQASNGQLLTPPGGSSLDSWRQILQLDSGHEEAARQVQSIEDRLISQVEQSIQAGQWDDARGHIARALVHFPDSIKLQELKLLNERAVADAERPRITRLQVSAHAIDELAEVAPTQLPVEDMIFVGFAYQGFKPQAELEVRLFEGRPGIELERRYLQLDAAEGVRLFSLQNSLHGFASGAYRLEIWLEQRLLSNRDFEIQYAPGPPPGNSPASPAASQ
ncbi:MAG: protein kinase [Gammaproteobacteria bacterium]|nr:protein kinase [Gammaproteobacteria bacterium]